MSILGWIIFGAIVGVIAKFLMPGDDPGGIIVTILFRHRRGADRRFHRSGARNVWARTTSGRLYHVDSRGDSRPLGISRNDWPQNRLRRIRPLA